MLPYLPPPIIHLGAFKISPFLPAALLGIWVMWFILKQQISRRQLNQQVATDLFLIAVCIGLPLAHVFKMLWQYYDYTCLHPSILFQLNKGVDSFGGFLGFTLGFIGYILITKPRFRLLPYADCLAYSICFGWIICRAACALSHDHPSRLSLSFLAINYPHEIYGGISRHNLGLDEMLGLMLIFLILYFINKKQRADGIIMAALILLYSPFRFALDFLRAKDIINYDLRFGGLTPAQWGCIVLFVFGLYSILRIKTNSTTGIAK